MLATSSSQEIRKYFMFAVIFYWDYPPLHQSSAELVLCGQKIADNGNEETGITPEHPTHPTVLGLGLGLGLGQGRSQPHSPGWARVPLSSFFLKF